MSIPPDKWLHFGAGQVAALLALLPVLTLNAAWWIPAVVAVTIGALKEAYDHFHQDRHTVDVLDILATGLGCLPVVITLGVARGY